MEVPHSRYSHVAAVGTPSVAENLKEYPQFHGSRLNYTPATEMDYGTVACWASNQVGKQRTPCLFQVNAFLSFILRCTGSLQFSEFFTTRYYLKWTILGILGIENNLNTFIVVWIYTLQMNGLVMILFFMIVTNTYSKISWHDKIQILSCVTACAFSVKCQYQRLLLIIPKQWKIKYLFNDHIGAFHFNYWSILNFTWSVRLVYTNKRTRKRNQVWRVNEFSKATSTYCIIEKSTGVY